MNRYNKPLRSLLFVPGHIERFIDKASKSKADALILDVEDSVLNPSNKIKARKLIAKKLEIFERKQLFIRVNNVRSGYIVEDIMNCVNENVNGVVVPKVKDGRDVSFVDNLLLNIEIMNNIKEGTFKIIPLIETVSALRNLKDICLFSDRVIANAFGSEDFIASLGGFFGKDGTDLTFARNIIIHESKANNVIPIDTVNIEVGDLDKLEIEVKESKRMGFDGKLALHPKELDIIHKYYTPSEEDIKKAKKMIEMAKQANENDRSVSVIDGEFIGPPMSEWSEKILKKHGIISDYENRSRN